MKLGLRDYTPSEIGITGLHPVWNWDNGITGPPLPGPYYRLDTLEYSDWWFQVQDYKTDK